VWNNLHIIVDIIFRPTMTHVVISLRGQLDIQRQALRHDRLRRFFDSATIPLHKSVRVVRILCTCLFEYKCMYVHTHVRTRKK
jgi:hypothetical protein